MDAEYVVEPRNSHDPELTIVDLIELKKQSSIEETDEDYGKNYDICKII